MHKKLLLASKLIAIEHVDHSMEFHENTKKLLHFGLSNKINPNFEWSNKINCI